MKHPERVKPAFSAGVGVMKTEQLPGSVSRKSMIDLLAFSELPELTSFQLPGLAYTGMICNKQAIGPIWTPVKKLVS